MINKKIFNSIMIIGLIFSICVAIRYSDWRLFNVPTFIQKIFLKPMNSDGILLNLSLGYIISAMFYLMLVYFPDLIRRKKVSRVIVGDLLSIYEDAIKLLVLMYKNATPKDEWKKIRVSEDSKFFNNQFYDSIRNFDIDKPADSLYKHKNTKDETFTWGDKLRMDLTGYQERINNLISVYVNYIDEELIDAIISFKTNKFNVAFLGLPSSSSEWIFTGINGEKYSENLPLLEVMKSQTGNGKIFQKNSVCDNIILIKDFADTLINLKKYLIKDKNYKNDKAYQLFYISDCGHNFDAK